MDRIQAMRAFVATVDHGSFAKAADILDLSRPVLTRLVSGLEDSLGAKLLHRTTRRLSLTESGERFLEACRNVFSLLDEAESDLSQQTQCPKGVLRLSAPMAFSLLHLEPVIAEFMSTYPSIEVDMELADRRVDLVEEAFDLSIRIAHELEPGLIARRIGGTALVTCASPEYLKLNGLPESPDDLRTHECMGFSLARRNSWSFLENDKVRYVDVRGRFKSNNGIFLAKLAESGKGIVQLPCFIVNEALREKRLVTVLKDYQPPNLDIYCVYQSREYLPQKVRLFIDFMSEYFSCNCQKIVTLKSA
ncbi:Transcriptional regulator [Hahella chejuensis KCTC 2396]|uniref:Transcriptional regulator n=1 Tax=Hahella chejuensis (strain KCTC 2396) TaxID=349521 RepID=Q2SCR3_HAHCH|nr:LysR family transcriptional regulator [Hahella chejuensis]ABC31561.1 Transcriptional regulator [Hahella chejuensis KCTC 2396]